jgi:hypothetical protein
MNKSQLHETRKETLPVIASIEAITAMAKLPGPIPQEFIFERTALGAFFNFTQRIVYHSPTGMEWGYLGSGPADAALNVLIYFCDGATAFKMHQRFKEAFISTLPEKGRNVIRAESVASWIAAQQRTEQETERKARLTERQTLEESLF